MPKFVSIFCLIFVGVLTLEAKHQHFNCDSSGSKAQCMDQLKETVIPIIESQIEYAKCVERLAETLKEKLSSAAVQKKLNEKNLALKKSSLKYHLKNLKKSVDEIVEILDIVKKTDSAKLVTMYSPHRFNYKSKHFLSNTKWCINKLKALVKKLEDEVPGVPILLKCDSPKNTSLELAKHRILAANKYVNKTNSTTVKSIHHTNRVNNLHLHKRKHDHGAVIYKNLVTNSNVTQRNVTTKSV